MVELNWNSFEICSIDSKGQQIFEKFDKNQYEFDSFDSTPEESIFRN